MKSKNTWVKSRHKYVHAFLRPIFRVFLKIKYNYNSKKYNLDEKPYVVLSNHQTTLDPFMVALSFKRQLYYMSSTDLFSSKYGKIIDYLVAPIPKSKSVRDLGAIKSCLRVIKEKGSICIFPEGNRTYDGNTCYIDPSIVKLLKLLKVDVVLYNIKGGYGIDPRWCYKGRKGKSIGEVVEVLKYTDIEKMDNESLYRHIIQKLTVNEIPTDSKFNSKAPAEGLERVFYYCPKCKSIQTIKTCKNKVYCLNCGFEAIYTEKLELIANDKSFGINYVKDWYALQINYIKSLDFENSKGVIFFDDYITLLTMHYKKRGQVIGNGKIMIYKDTFKFQLDNGDFEIKIVDIYSCSLLGKHKLNIYFDDNVYQVKGTKELNVLKYLQLYYVIKSKRNGELECEFLGL